MTTFSKIILAAALLALGAPPLLAAEKNQAEPTVANPAQKEAAAAAMSDGEVKKVDKEAGTITLRHGPLKNLGMGGMTMVFRVQDPALLEKVKAGDKVKFVAENVNGTLTVMHIEAAR